MTIYVVRSECATLHYNAIGIVIRSTNEGIQSIRESQNIRQKWKIKTGGKSFPVSSITSGLLMFCLEVEVTNGKELKCLC